MKFQNEWPAYEANDHLNNYIKGLFQTLPLFTSLQDDGTVLNVYTDIQKFKIYSDVLIFGIGGSSLGGQAVYALKTGGKPNLHFIDNIDPAAFLSQLNVLDLKQTAIICISKSGNTAEPLMQLLLTVQHYEKQNIDWQKQCAVLTEPTDNALRLFAKKHRLLSFDHPTDIGGRYNVFTSVGALVAGLCDFEFSKFRQGARDFNTKIRFNRFVARGYAHSAAAYTEKY
jgi:glucose-6-phosphate isomerase